VHLYRRERKIADATVGDKRWSDLLGSPVLGKAWGSMVGLWAMGIWYRDGAAMLTARVATAAAGMIIVVKAAMELVMAVASKPAAAMLAAGWGLVKGEGGEGTLGTYSRRVARWTGRNNNNIGILFFAQRMPAKRTPRRPSLAKNKRADDNNKTAGARSADEVVDVEPLAHTCQHLDRKVEEKMAGQFFVREKELAPLAPATKLLDPSPPTPTLSVDLTGLGLDGCVVDRVLSPTECGRIIRACTATGFSYWDPDGRCDESSYVRSCDTLEFDGTDLCDEIWRRLAPFLPATCELLEPDERWQHDLEGKWEARGLNSHLLVNKYLAAGHFAPHVDGSVQVCAHWRAMPSSRRVGRGSPECTSPQTQ
jgi:hypothetical protein